MSNSLLHIAPLIALAMVSPCLPVEPSGRRAAPAVTPAMVIPFDFQSTFDHGRYGRMVGELIWKQLDRRGGWVLPESMLDVRDWSVRRKTRPGPQTSLEEMQRIIRDDFDAQIGIWGSVERVAGFERDVYDVSIRIADFSGAAPRMIYQRKARTKVVSEIPHVIVKAALDRLCGSGATTESSRSNPRRAERRRDGPNLVRSDFEHGRRGPVGWDPLPPHVTWTTAHAGNGSQNHIIRFQLPKPMAASTGVLYYSDYFPVAEGATYRCQCRWRSTGSQVKIFVKCYDRLADQYLAAGRHRARHGYRPQSGQRREVYRSQQNLKGPTNRWNVHVEDFTPRHTQFTPRWGRVMLYAYWPAGTVDWDDVVVKQIVPPNSTGQRKLRRPSLETKVRSEQLERSP